MFNVKKIYLTNLFLYKRIQYFSKYGIFSHHFFPPNNTNIFLLSRFKSVFNGLRFSEDPHRSSNEHDRCEKIPKEYPYPTLFPSFFFSFEPSSRQKGENLL